MARAPHPRAGGEPSGGPAPARVIVLFASCWPSTAPIRLTVGAVAPQLKASFHIGDADIGLLSSLALVGAVFTIPVGLLLDGPRMPLLALTVILWSLASLFSAFAGGFGSLLLTRLALGAVAATAGPAIASLTGDYFPAAERGRMYSYILVGEVAGTAFGFIVAGVASPIDWRASFILLAIPGLLSSRASSGAPSPSRCEADRALCGGAMELGEASPASAGGDGRPVVARRPRARPAEEAAAGGGEPRRAVPTRSSFCIEDPQTMRLWRSSATSLRSPPTS